MKIFISDCKDYGYINDEINFDFRYKNLNENFLLTNNNISTSY
jgi:hypothetical protein